MLPTLTFSFVRYLYADPSSRVVKSVGLRPLACCDRGFESHPGAWMFVCCECCVLSGRCLCDGLITRPEESYRLWRVAVCDQVTLYASMLKPDRELKNTHPLWVVYRQAGKKKIFTH